MIECIFTLNDKPMSTFGCGSVSFPAFSGLGEHANRRLFACVAGIGPIPPGTYYIFDRQSGGLLGPLRDIFTQRDDWFALYAIDGHIDDEAYCESVKRGNFRLHPKGASGRSEGCVVINQKPDFLRLYAMLKSAAPVQVPGSSLKAYGRLTVK